MLCGNGDEFLIPTEVKVTRDYIEASVWVKRGNMIVQRDCLDFTDPDSYWKLWYDEFEELLPEDLQIKLWGKILDSKDAQIVLRGLEKPLQEEEWGSPSYLNWGLQ